MAAKITRLQLLEHVNKLNLDSGATGGTVMYWTVTVMYNTVVWRKVLGQRAEIYETYEGIPT